MLSLEEAHWRLSAPSRSAPASRIVACFASAAADIVVYDYEKLDYARTSATICRETVSRPPRAGYRYVLVAKSRSRTTRRPRPTGRLLRGGRGNARPSGASPMGASEGPR